MPQPQPILVAFLIAAIPGGGRFVAQTAGVAESQSAPVVSIPRLASSSETVELSFDGAVNLKNVFVELSEQAGVTLLFDEAFRDQTTDVNLGRLSVEEALDRVTVIHRLFYKILDPTTVLIAPDNAQKHRQYDEMLLHTFYVEHNDVNSVANLFRTLVGIQRVLPDPDQKSISVRATADQILVAHSILERNDAPPARGTLRVEVLALDGDVSAASVAQGVVTSEAFARIKREGGAEVLVSQSLPLIDGERGSIAMEAIARGGEAPAESPRRVGLRLSVAPRLARAGSAELSVTLEATAVSTARQAELRTRDVTTSITTEPGEIGLLPVGFRVGELGAALKQPDEQEDRRAVVVAIEVMVQPGEVAAGVLPPLRMGTEQQVRIRR